MTNSQSVDCVSDSHVGSGALSSVYPNIIEAVEETDGEVNCMTRIGKNGFFWSLAEDKIWYYSDNVLA